MRKILLSCFTVIALVSMMICIAACNNSFPEKHEHTIASEWSFDEYHHFHEASCAYVNHREDVEVHEGDNCFCGYSKDGQNQPPSGNETGSDSFNNITLTENGILSFDTIKGATKYVLSFTSASSEQSIELSGKATSINLEKNIQGGFPAGKTTVKFVAWKIDSITIDGETITEEVPMDEASETFVVIKSNGIFEMRALSYIDEFVKMDGFYISKQVTDNVAEYTYEMLLKDNQKQRYNISKNIYEQNGSAVKYYKSNSDRESDKNPYGPFDLNLFEVNHGANYIYMRAADSNGQYKDYNLRIQGLYTLTIQRYKVEVINEDKNGIKEFNNIPIGQSFTYAERDIILQSVLFENIEEGLAGRDDQYNMFENGDLILADGNSEIRNLYFYEKDSVYNDCSEYATNAQYFMISESAGKFSLSGLNNGEQSVSVPYVIAGKQVSSISFFSDKNLKEIHLSEGFETYPVKLSYCDAVTDVYLPSTITTMESRCFGALPKTATVHCAFSKEYADSKFPYDWNYINGTLYDTYKTLYEDEGSSGSENVSALGIKYRIENNTAIVIDTTDSFNGKIPDTIKVGKDILPVVSIEKLGDCSSLEITIGKNISFIQKDVFKSYVKSIVVSAENEYFVADKGVLTDIDVTRVIAAGISDSRIFIESSVTSIDQYALSRTYNGQIYEAYVNMSQEKMQSLLNNISTDGFRFHASSYSTEIEGVSYLVDKSDEYAQSVIVIDVALSDNTVTLQEQIDGIYVKGIDFYHVSFEGVTSITAGLSFLSNMSENWFGGSFESIQEINIIGNGGGYSWTFDSSKMPNLKKFVVDEQNEKYCSIDGILYNKEKTQIEGVPNRLSGEITIPNGIVSVWISGTDITSITLPETCTVFSLNDMNSLQTVNLPATLEEIPFEAFRGCSSLKNIVLPTSLKKIGERAFKDCFALENIEIPSGCVLEDAVFFGCVGLKNVTFKAPESNQLQSGNRVFEHCGQLKQITIEASKSDVMSMLNQYDINYFAPLLTDGSYVKSVKCSDGDLEVYRT